MYEQVLGDQRSPAELISEALFGGVEGKKKGVPKHSFILVTPSGFEPLIAP